MRNRIGGAVRSARSAVNSGLDRVGGWGQSMGDRFDSFSGDVGGRVGRRMGTDGMGGRGERGGNGERDGEYSQDGSWRYA